jgi:hypothetical protein
MGTFGEVRWREESHDEFKADRSDESSKDQHAPEACALFSSTSLLTSAGDHLQLIRRLRQADSGMPSTAGRSPRYLKR